MEGVNNSNSTNKATKQSTNSSNPDFISTLNAAMSTAEKERYENFDVHKRITEMRETLEAIDTITTGDETQWLMAKLSKNSNKDLLRQLIELDKKIEQVKQNQENIMKQMSEPAIENPGVAKAEMAHMLSSHTQLSHDVQEMKRLSEQVQEARKVDEGILQTVEQLKTAMHQIEAMRSNVEALQNTVMTLNRKIGSSHWCCRVKNARSSSLSAFITNFFTKTTACSATVTSASSCSTLEATTVIIY